jgi:hypothetical protein
MTCQPPNTTGSSGQVGQSSKTWRRISQDQYIGTTLGMRSFVSHEVVGCLIRLPVSLFLSLSYQTLASSRPACRTSTSHSSSNASMPRD